MLSNESPLTKAIKSIKSRLPFLKCKCADTPALMACLVTRPPWGEVNLSGRLHSNACSTGTPSDTCLCPSSPATAAKIPQSLADEE